MDSNYSVRDMPRLLFISFYLFCHFIFRVTPLLCVGCFFRLGGNGGFELVVTGCVLHSCDMMLLL